ncbi:glycosyltransferase 87 family protein [Streptacidiphilus sp. MAP5-3]|uniref:glycosyltransferase 87 family protein n=1 Tax=unclassified Streptacidiphilus TaxID=2643834 RepID=UPI0035118B8B
MTSVRRGTGGVREAVLAAREALREAPRRTTRNAALAAFGSLLLYVVIRHLAHVSMIDSRVYQAEGAAVVHGRDLYQLRVGPATLPATYPPFAAMLFTPVSWLSISALRIVVTLINLGQLAVVAVLCCRFAGWPSRALRPATVLLITGFGVWLEPVWTTLRYGQINLLILGLILFDLALPDSRRYKGIAIGLAAGLKVTPGLFIVYLLLTRRFRAAGTAVASFAGTVLLGAAVLPHAAWTFWTKDLYITSRVGKEWIVDNQSLRGLMDRLELTMHSGNLTLVLVAVVAVGGLAVAVLLDRRCRRLPRNRAWSVLTCAVTMLLISPISWTHHWVWCLPLMVVLGAEVSAERARQRRGVAAPGFAGRQWRVLAWITGFVFCCYSMWLVPHGKLTTLHLPFYARPVVSIYPLYGLAFLALMAERVRRALRRSGGFASVWELWGSSDSRVGSGGGDGADRLERSTSTSAVER